VKLLYYSPKKFLFAKTTYELIIPYLFWIWKLKLPEKLKFLFWLACHNSVPTLLLLSHRNIAPSPLCSRCGLEDETFLHCVHDCNFSNIIWHHVGLHDVTFFANLDVIDEWSMGPHYFLFAPTIGGHGVTVILCV